MKMLLSSNSMMASSQIKIHNVFPSFHGPDVRTKFLSHLRYHFARKGITTFNDQEIKRGHTIGPELEKAIRESRISVVLLSENYASSSWCLEELVEILKCEKDLGQLVMTIFYEVDPSDVRKQKGDFGRAFKKTCEGKTEEVKQRWIEALQYVATIAEEHSINWDNEAEMAEKFATDVSNKLNVSLSRDFDNMVGLQAHLRKVNTLLCLESDEVKMIGIWGPAGIGKSTIARALYNQLSGQFPLRCLMDSCKSILGVYGNYESRLCLQNEFLSRTLNQREMRVNHLGVMKERLHDQRVLAILDDVDDLDQLDVLANESSWFGPGSRIIVTTEDRNILKAHGIQDIYDVPFPWEEEALEILCLAAFKQRFVPHGFEEVARKVAMLCGNLPLGLRVVGSSLRGQSKHEWELQLSRVKTSLDRKIEDILRVGYDRLSKNDQSLFRHLACIFHHETVYGVKIMLADSYLDVENGLKTLAAKSLVEFDDRLLLNHETYDTRRTLVEFGGRLLRNHEIYHTHRPLVEIDHIYFPHLYLSMHPLLQQLGRQVVREQSDEPGKRQFLVEAKEIRDVLAKGTGTGSIIGISLDMSKIGEFSLSGQAFKGMDNLQFFKIYGSDIHKRATLGISEDMKYLLHLRLLDWESFPGKCLPPTFRTECLVAVKMQYSKLERLWRGIQPLANLEFMNMRGSWRLKEIPNLSEATNLKKLVLSDCKSLVELPSSISNLHKLEILDMRNCKKLQVIPTNINLASLERVDMNGCSRLRTFPDISSNIKILKIEYTKIQDVPASVVGRWSRLDQLLMGCEGLKRLTHVPACVSYLDLSESYIKRIPDCVIGLPLLATLIVKHCSKLVSLHNLRPSLLELQAFECGSLKSVSFSYITLDNRNCVKMEKEYRFGSCFSLKEEARRQIIQQWAYKILLLPGKEIPEEFTHKAIRNSITISSGTFSVSSRFKACLLLLPNPDIDLLISCNGVLINELHFSAWDRGPLIKGQHRLVFSGYLFKEDSWLEVDAATSGIQFEFRCKVGVDNIIACGVQMLEEEVEGCSSKRNEQSVVKSSKHTCWWICDYGHLLFLLIMLFFFLVVGVSFL